VSDSTLTAFLDAARARVDAALERWLPAPPQCPAILSDAMRYSLFAGGKRLRPMLTLAAADAAATPDCRAAAFDLALPAACAMEFIHTYSLIHDDLPSMDNDVLRRGRPTLHVVYGDGIAILAADGLHTEAFALLAREPAAGAGLGPGDRIAERKLRTLHVIADAAGSIGMVGGQAIDLQAAGKAPGHALTLDPASLRTMHAKKTGALIRASALSGAIMAGARAEVADAIDRYATELGLAFQIVDDILDVEGDPALLGKSAGKDVAGDKPTYPSLFGLDRSRQLAADCLTHAKDALAGVGFSDSHLAGIADWVISRKN
jgi:geranylgeranyl diphosphate synthase type II